MTDTNRPEAVHDVLRDMRQWKGDYSVFADRIERTLSARASAGEGGVTDEMVERGTRIAYGDQPRDACGMRMRKDIRKILEGALHPQESIFTAAPQPAQAGASGGGEPDLRKYRGVAQMAIDYASLVATPVDEDLARELLAVIDHKHDLTHNPDTGVVKCYGCNYESRETTTPASPATGDAATWEEEIRRHDATPPAHGDGEGDIEAAAIALANHDRKHPNARAYWDWLHDDEKAKFRSKARAVLSATRPTPEAMDAAREVDGYLVHRNGTIWHDGKQLTPYSRGKGYMCVSMWRDGARKDEYVHRIVASAWCTRLSPEQTQVNHRDGDPTNNAADNLEWCSPEENSIHATRVLFSQCRSIVGTEISTGKEVTFRSLAEAKDHGFKPGNIDKCLKGLRKKHGGYTWRDATAVAESNDDAINAARYRWLRDDGAGVLHVYAGTDGHSLLPDELDAAIDAALALPAQGEG